MKRNDWARELRPLDMVENVSHERLTLSVCERLWPDRRKGRITMKKTKKRTIVTAAAAAAMTLAAVTAGAAISGISHKDNVDSFLGEGAGDRLESMGITSSAVTENGYFRITADAVLSDGENAVIFVTKERLTDDGFGLNTVDPEDRFVKDTVMPVFTAADGSAWDHVEIAGDDVAEGESGMITGERYYVSSAASAGQLTVDFKDISVFDEYWSSLSQEERDRLSGLSQDEFSALRDEINTPYYVQGLSLTLDLSKNFEPAEFVSEDGSVLRVTPYDISAEGSVGGRISSDIRLFAPDGSETLAQVSDGSWDGNDQALSCHYNFANLIDDPSSYDYLIIDTIGTFYRR